MRPTGIAFIVTAGLAAQVNAPVGIVRGDLVAWYGNAHAGTITLRNSDQRLLKCSFDNLTWFEHTNEHVAISALEAGDHLEMVADRNPPSSSDCYARTVQILDAVAPHRTILGKPRLRLLNSATESWAPRGEMTLSGLVAEVQGNWLTMRLRDRSERRVLLRTDTRYLGEGLPQERIDLAPQMRIFVRAGTIRMAMSRRTRSSGARFYKSQTDRSLAVVARNRC